MEEPGAGQIEAAANRAMARRGLTVGRGGGRGLGWCGEKVPERGGKLLEAQLAVLVGIPLPEEAGDFFVVAVELQLQKLHLKKWKKQKQSKREKNIKISLYLHHTEVVCTLF